MSIHFFIWFQCVLLQRGYKPLLRIHWLQKYETRCQVPSNIRISSCWMYKNAEKLAREACFRPRLKSSVEEQNALLLLMVLLPWIKAYDGEGPILMLIFSMHNNEARLPQWRSAGKLRLKQIWGHHIWEQIRFGSVPSHPSMSMRRDFATIGCNWSTLSYIPNNPPVCTNKTFRPCQ